MPVEKPEEHNGPGEELRRMAREEGGKPTRVYERIKDPLKVGRGVRVRRSSGEVEGGWEIFGFEENGHLVIVRKQEGSEVLVKKVSIRELEELNPPEDASES